MSFVIPVVILGVVVVLNKISFGETQYTSSKTNDDLFNLEHVSTYARHVTSDENEKKFTTYIDPDFIVHHGSYIEIRCLNSNDQVCVETNNDSNEYVTIMSISDTHGMHDEIDTSKWKDANIDILIHSGDFTMTGLYHDIENYDKWIKNLKENGIIKESIVIAGNHDITLDSKYYQTVGFTRFHNTPEKFEQIEKVTNIGDLESVSINDILKQYSQVCKEAIGKNSHYLQDSFVEIMGLKIYGSPYQPYFGNWAFNQERGKISMNRWNLIPNDCDIVLTHGPPFLHGDRIVTKQYVGCKELLTKLNQIKPKFHISGHLHEAWGVSTDDRNNETVFINAATVDVNYRVKKGGQMNNPPILFKVEKRQF